MRGCSCPWPTSSAITRAAPRWRRTSVKPPVDAPTSRQSSPAGSTPNASSACASFSPPRETNRGARSTLELGRLVDLLARLRSGRERARRGSAPGPGHGSRRAPARPAERRVASSASPNGSRRRSAARRREAGDDLRSSTDVSAAIAARRACARASRLVGQPPRRRPGRARARSRRRRGCRRRSGRAGRARRRTPATAAGPPPAAPAAHSGSATDAEKRQPVFSRWTASRSASGSIVSRYWPPIIPSVASASSRATCGRRVRAREPERLGEQGVAGEDRLRPRRTPPRRSACRAAPRRRRGRAGRRGRARSCAPSRARAAAGITVGRLGPERLADGERDHRPDALAAHLDERVAGRLALALELRPQLELARARPRRARAARQALRIGLPLRLVDAPRAAPSPPPRPRPAGRSPPRGRRSPRPAARAPRAGRSCSVEAHVRSPDHGRLPRDAARGCR